MKGLWRAHILEGIVKPVFRGACNRTPAPLRPPYTFPPQESLHDYHIGHLLLGNKLPQNSVA